ncbi:MAG: hypothetical protein ACXABY_00585 [Candidatus Thorarchaeota archaeon]|jgi:hypothetical protein
MEPAIQLKAVSLADTGTVIPAKEGFSIVVFGYILVADGAVALTWGSGSVDISGTMTLATPFVLGVSGSRYPVLRTSHGEALVLTMSAAQNVGGHVTYAYVSATARL